MPYSEVKLSIDYKMRALCFAPYPNHPKGCPNFGKKKGCPPQAPLVENYLDLSKPTYAIWNIYDFKSHTDKMRAKHPNWSKRQVDCCLYWQPTARNSLKEEILIFKKEFPKLTIIKCPEAQGVNLTDTMKSIGHELEWPPETVTYQIAVAGEKK